MAQRDHADARRGTVWLAFADGFYLGYWDGLPDGTPGVLEQCPEMQDLEEALEWARERSRRVFIRPERDPGTYYWAGDDPVPNSSHFPNLKRLTSP